ncbi:MAG: gamma-glutamyltransferase [Jatrophihabitantaceae bacterium]
MTNHAGPPREAALATEAMVLAHHPAVSAVGLATLQSGGNAIDASLAMAAMCWLTLPGQCGVGGDAFAVVREPDGRIWTVGASGFGPDGGEPDFYRGLGLTAVPLSGPLAVAGPGTIAAIAALHEGGASRPLAELWAAAIRTAEHGLACTAKTRGDILEHESRLRSDAGMSAVFLRGGRAPQLGERLVFAELAQSMRMLAADPGNLYRGELAERAVATLVAGGAPFSGAEWQATSAALVGPAISHDYRSITVHQTPPPSPGWMLLQQAAICDGLLADLPWLGTDAVDLFAGAARQAFQDRWDRCGSDTDAWRDLLEPDSVAAARAGLFDRRRATTGLSGHGDTTSTVVVDSDGRAVSFIQSLALTFGAHLTVPGTGIVLNNRLGRGSYLIDGHPNEVRPRRRPLHTLNAWLATDAEGRLLHAGNCPGGDGQVQWNMQVLSHLVDHALDPQQAVSAPRFSVYPGSDADTVGAPHELVCESRLGEAVLGELAAAGHRVRTQGPWDGGGGALVISVDHQLGALAGGVDPRQNGVALGV